ncbi:hypothetical protein ACWFPQ_17040 [Peribacillus butanolivorans]
MKFIKFSSRPYESTKKLNYLSRKGRDSLIRIAFFIELTGTLLHYQELISSSFSYGTKGEV